MTNDEKNYLTEKIKSNEELINDQEDRLQKLIKQKKQQPNAFNYDLSIEVTKDTIDTAKREIAKWKEELNTGKFNGYY